MANSPVPAMTDPRIPRAIRAGIAAEVASPDSLLGDAVRKAAHEYATEAGMVSSWDVNALVTCTAAAYEELAEKDQATLYLVTDAGAIYLGDTALASVAK